MGFRDLYNELKRRNVIKVATVYGITAWVIAQVISLAADTFGAPGWVMKMVIILLIGGFPLALVFAWAFELTPDGIKKTDHVPLEVSQTDETGQKLNWMIIGSLIVLLVFVGIERIWFAGSYSEPRPFEATNASIAVLPFDNISISGEEDAYFSDGLSEELLNTLAGVDSMKVAGRSSSFRFKGDNIDMKQVGEQLGVRHILEGSVRKAGNKVRITVQLVNAENGDYMWSKTYDRTLNDIFAIQEDISKAVLSELKVRLLPKAKERLETIPTGDVEAYQTYLKANQVIASRNIDDINRSIKLYQQAIELDPDFAQAHAKLSIAYFLQGYYGNVPLREVQQKMRAAADRALLLDGNLGEAYGAIGLYYHNVGDYEEARDAWLKSLELNPNQPYVHGWLGNVYERLKGIGSTEQIEYYKKMYELDPLAPISLFNYALIKKFAGDFQSAEKTYRKNIRLNPEFIGSYTNLAELKYDPPFGRIDSAFIYGHRASRQDSSATSSMYMMSDLAARLDITSITEHFHQKLQKHYPNNQNAVMVSLAYSQETGRHSVVEDVVFPYLNQSGLPPTYTPDLVFYPLAAWAHATSEYARVIDAIEAQAPELFQDSIGKVNQGNYYFADVLIGLLRAEGREDRAKQLTKSYCRGIEKIQDDLLEGRYSLAKATCLLHRGDYEQALPYVKEYFLEKNGIYYAPRIFERPAFAEAMQRPGYQKVRRQVEAELDRQRENLIGHLKEEGDWQESWEE